MRFGSRLQPRVRERKANQSAEIGRENERRRKFGRPEMELFKVAARQTRDHGPRAGRVGINYQLAQSRTAGQVLFQTGGKCVHVKLVDCNLYPNLTHNRTKRTDRCGELTELETGPHDIRNRLQARRPNPRSQTRSRAARFAMAMLAASLVERPCQKQRDPGAQVV